MCAAAWLEQCRPPTPPSIVTTHRAGPVPTRGTNRVRRRGGDGSHRAPVPPSRCRPVRCGRSAGGGPPFEAWAPVSSPTRDFGSTERWPGPACTGTAGGQRWMPSSCQTLPKGFCSPPSNGYPFPSPRRDFRTMKSPRYHHTITEADRRGAGCSAADSAAGTASSSRTRGRACRAIHDDSRQPGHLSGRDR